MDAKNLGLEAGTWLVGNCGKTPSVKNCKLVMMAPESQKADLMEASVAHLVKTHGHTDSPEFRTEFEKTLETMMV